MTLSYLCAPELLHAFGRPALVVGHPGHELKVFGWMSEYKPRVYVLTDGAGRQGISRLSSTTRLLEPLAIEIDGLFGTISDAALYQLILAREIPWFLGALDRLTESFIENGVDLVVADAMEGFNPAHDICRTLVDAAVLAVENRTVRAIANYMFCLTESEQGRRQERHDDSCLHLALDDEALLAKITAAEEYAELKDEVQTAIALRGKEYFRIECLKKVSAPFQKEYPAKPEYETWGERRVAEGSYQSVIRYQEHMLPIIDAIRNRALASKGPAARAAAAGSSS